jgi:C-terminal processing protease CtpA/Prc
MPSHRALQNALADTIEAHYVFPEVAAAVAAEVRSWDAAGDEPPFEEWTRRLRLFDRHFRVVREAPTPVAREVQAGDTGAFLRTHPRGRIGVLVISEFVDPDERGRAEELAEALRWLADFDAAIVDVRGNHGGWPTMVAAVAGPLLGQPPVHVVDFTTRTGVETSYTTPADDDSALTWMPLAVLIDGGTASAAESFAYLLSTTRRAVIVGERSAGAANPGTFFDTGAGFAVFVSTGAPLDPRTSTNWEAVGVAPDHDVPSSDAEDAAMEVLTEQLTHRPAP